MRAFVLLACVALAYGRPEPPVGYSYSAPASSGRYHAPSSSYAAPSGSYGAPSAGGHRGSLGGHSAGLSFGGHSSGGLSLGGDSGFGGGYAGGYSGAPLVQKHIYVHVPPQEPQEYRAPRIHSVAAPQKHYKIIFIKAPTPPTPVAPIIPVQPQNEEKTLVYVLVKKPEDQPDIVIPTPAPTQPAKPEVYFIKYQTQKESGGAAGGAIGGGLGGGIGGGLGGSGFGGDGLSGGDHGAAGPSGAGASGHGGDIGGDFGGDSGADSGHSGATSSQYGPPGHVAGPLH